MAKEPTRQQYLLYELYADYGHAVLEAQRFEINLGTVLFFLEGRKRAILKKPSSQEIDAMLDEIDGQVVGTLLKQLIEFHFPSDEETSRLFKVAADNRNTLVHHFMKEEVAYLEPEALEKAISRVAELVGPISEAKRVSGDFAKAENDRMQAEILARI